MDERLFQELSRIARKVPQLEYNSEEMERLRNYVFSECNFLGSQISLLYKFNPKLRGCDLAKVLMKETFPNVIYRHKNYKNTQK